ncbi:hypothetical protein [Pacificoceanicola onchidii]|uniref:hypothetical protein n=1 Tax=Pacificoceanicola onchidii TaxID=2562685 RepID=UPI001455E070|nr:hypothetical protein [Pacificoceanicola onchidii]
MVQRVFLAGLALGPALAILLLPTSAMSAPASFTLGGAGSLVTVCASIKRRGGKPTAPDARGLLLQTYNAETSRPLARDMRSGLAFLLSPEPEGFRSAREAAIAAALTEVIQTWGHAAPEQLSDAELHALTQLHALLQSDSAKAGALAQQFAQPAAVLDLRDVVADFGEAQAA